MVWTRLKRWCARVLSVAMSLSIAVGLLSCSANPPRKQNDLCSVFDQKRSWHKAARKAEKKWGMPVHVGMAFVHRESSFTADARPPRNKILGVVPWRRPSSAYGYAQATDEAWADYEKETDRWFVDRDNFADAIDFVGWYNHKSHRRLGIAKADAYRLYLAYYSGHGGYQRGTWKTGNVQGYARKVADQAARYQRQYTRC